MPKTVIYSSHAPEPIGPYSQAVQAGDQLWVSGQIALDRATGQLVSGDIQAETRQVMKNIEHILVAAGFTFDHIVKCSIFLADMNTFPQVNEIYGAFFAGLPPARETVEVTRLPKDVRVEISCIAVK
jgi:2-iminobutanoate/2-iminopropanoate deaminase